MAPTFHSKYSESSLIKHGCSKRNTGKWLALFHLEAAAEFLKKWLTIKKRTEIDLELEFKASEMELEWTRKKAEMELESTIKMSEFEMDMVTIDQEMLLQLQKIELK